MLICHMIAHGTTHENITRNLHVLEELCVYIYNINSTEIYKDQFSLPDSKVHRKECFKLLAAKCLTSRTLPLLLQVTSDLKLLPY